MLIKKNVHAVQKCDNANKTYPGAAAINSLSIEKYPSADTKYQNSIKKYPKAVIINAGGFHTNERIH